MNKESLLITLHKIRRDIRYEEYNFADGKLTRLIKDIESNNIDFPDHHCFACPECGYIGRVKCQSN